MSDGAGLTENIAAPADKIIDALTDFETFPQWQGPVVACEVQERDADGRGSLVRMTVDAKVRTLEYVVRYRYELPERLGWDLVSGDLHQNTGAYLFAPQDDGSTDVTMDIVVEPGFWMPGPMKKLLRDQALRNAIRDLRRHLGA